MSLSDRIAAHFAAMETERVRPPTPETRDANPALRAALEEMVSRLSVDRMFRQAFGPAPRVGVLDGDYPAPGAHAGLAGYFVGGDGRDDATSLLVDVSIPERVRVTVVPRKFGTEFARATGIWVDTPRPFTTEIDATADEPGAVASLTECLLARQLADVEMEGGYSLERPSPSISQRLGISRNPDMGEDTLFTRMVAAQVRSLEARAEIARRAAESAAAEADRRQAGDRDAFLGACPGLADTFAALGRDIHASDEAAAGNGGPLRLTAARHGRGGGGATTPSRHPHRSPWARSRAGASTPAAAAASR